MVLIIVIGWCIILLMFRVVFVCIILVKVIMCSLSRLFVNCCVRLVICCLVNWYRL